MRRWWTLFAAFGAATQAIAADYKLSHQGKQTGTLSVAVEGATRTVIVAPRGAQGPASRTALTTDGAGMLVAMDMEGTGWGGSRIFERLTTVNGRARWETGIDKGEASAAGYYVPLSFNAEQVAGLARALLSAPAGRLPVLPSGEIGIDAADTVALPGNVQAQLYLISGLGRRPLPVWLDKNRELIAQASAVEGSTIRDDLESALSTLLEVQEQRIVAAEESLAREAVERPATPVLIRNANLYDAVAARMRPRTDVLIRGERIEAVG